MRTDASIPVGRALRLRTGSRERHGTRRLAEDTGFDEFHVVRRDTVREVLTEERLRIVETLQEHDPESISALARTLDREKGAVKRDCDVLFRHDLVVFEEDGPAKAPRLKHEHVFVEPIY